MIGWSLVKVEAVNLVDMTIEMNGEMKKAT